MADLRGHMQDDWRRMRAGQGQSGLPEWKGGEVEGWEKRGEIATTVVG